MWTLTSGSHGFVSTNHNGWECTILFNPDTQIWVPIRYLPDMGVFMKRCKARKRVAGLTVVDV